MHRVRDLFGVRDLLRTRSWRRGRAPVEVAHVPDPVLDHMPAVAPVEVLRVEHASLRWPRAQDPLERHFGPYQGQHGVLAAAAPHVVPSPVQRLHAYLEEFHEEYCHYASCHHWDWRAEKWDDSSFLVDHLRWSAGFADRASLDAWFENLDFEALETAGFVIRAYQVPASHVRLGSSQVAFDAAAAVPLRVVQW